MNIEQLDNGMYLIDTVINCAGRRPPIKSLQKVEHTSEGEPVDTGSDQPEGIYSERWRLISSDVLFPSMAGTMVCVDYSYNNAEALKAAVDLINGEQAIPVMWDHSNSTKDICGWVEKASWENSKDISPGCNGYICADPAFDARAAIGLQKKLLNAGSISISAEMQPSHPEIIKKEGLVSFLDQMGNEVDGRIVSFQPVKLKSVNHMALVTVGADPNSKVRHSTSNTDEELTAKVAEQKKQDLGTAQNNTGVYSMEPISILSHICDALKVEAILTEETIPETLEAKLIEKLTALQDSKVELTEKFDNLAVEQNKLIDGILSLSAYVKTEEEDISTADVLDRLPAKLDFAKQGETYVDDLRQQALSRYDTAKIDADTKELSASAKVIRKGIEGCEDIEMLKAYINEFEPKAEARVGTDFRSSVGEDLPDDTAHAEIKVSEEEQKIRDAYRAISKKKNPEK